MKLEISVELAKLQGGSQLSGMLKVCYEYRFDDRFDLPIGMKYFDTNLFSYRFILF